MNKTLVAPKSVKKPPQIRQTLTSKYRLLKANPLLALEVAKKTCPHDSAKEHLLKPLKTLVEAMGNPPPRPSLGFKPKLNKTVGEVSTKKAIIRPSVSRKQTVIPKKDVKTIPRITVTTNSSNLSQNIKPRAETPIVPPRNLLTVIQEVVTPETPKEVAFKTPNNNLKSVLQTCTEAKNRLSTPTSTEMSRRLSDWLQRRGRSFRDYSHLKCFGICSHNKTNGKPTVIEENKENQIRDANSTFFINDEEKVIQENQIKNQTVVIEVQDKNLEFVAREGLDENLEFVAREALIDLYELIVEGYPPEQCEIWLKLIKQKYNKLEEEVQYWECRAALEQSKGNINSAVECCKTAIVQGAEVHQAEAFLDQLLQKFSLLNIGTETGKPATKEREKIVQEARNIFKSSIIQFAVQERKLKTKSKEGHVTIEKTLIATPVRRSTRLSRSGFTTTPGVKIYSSLKDLDGSIRDNLKFKSNSAIKD